MRDKRFIAEHRGGLLKNEQYVQLIKWACDCAVNVLPLFAGIPDERLKNALLIAKECAKAKVPVSDARSASLKAIAVANASKDRASIAVARAVGHAAATTHMADHSLGAALYALKAVKEAGKPLEAERNWQNKQLPEEIMELVMSARIKKEKDLKIFEHGKG